MNNSINGAGAIVPAGRKVDDGTVVESKINEVSVPIDQLESQAAPSIVAMNGVGQTATEATQSNLLALQSRERASEGVLILARQNRFSALSDLRDRDAEGWSELTRHMECLTFDLPREDVDNYIHGMREASKLRGDASSSIIKRQTDAINDVMKAEHSSQ